MKPILVHAHIYYPELYGELKRYIQNVAQSYPCELWITMVQEHSDVIEDAKASFEHLHIEIVPNRGYDVAPFMYVLNSVNLDDYSYVVKVHTKRDMPNSAHHNCFDMSGAKWRNYALNFMKKENFEKVLTAFETEASLGMSADYHLITEFEQFDISAQKLAIEFLKCMSLDYKKYIFVAGTMFIVRASLLKPLQKLALKFEDFQVPDKDHTQTFAHIIERVLGCMIVAQNAEIKDVFNARQYTGKFWLNMRRIGRFIYRKKITNSGKIQIKICKIPMPVKRKVTNNGTKIKYKFLGMPLCTVVNASGGQKRKYLWGTTICYDYNECERIEMDALVEKAIARPTKLFFDLSYGGGTESYFYWKKDELINSYNIIRIQYINAIKEYKISLYEERKSSVLWLKSFEDIKNVLPRLTLDEIVVNHLVGFPDTFLILDTIENIFKGRVKISTRGHDFFSVCPFLNLMTAQGYCGGPELLKCQKCFPCNEYENMPFGIDNTKIKIEDWRTKWEHFYRKVADELVVFSQSSKELFLQAYPTLEHIKVIPHNVLPLRKVQITSHCGINIGVLGTISGVAKGEKIINELETLLENRNDVKLVMFGEYQNKTSKTVVIGKYQRNCLPKLVEEQYIDIILIPSTCPETFSYTTSEAMLMGLPVACFDLGAQAEKIKQYKKRVVISKINAKVTLDEILAYVKKGE